MRRFHIQRTAEDADEGAVKIVRLSEEGTAEVLAEMTAPPADTPERRATFERADTLKPWTCDPCGSTNVVDRGNCAFCGKPR